MIRPDVLEMTMKRTLVTSFFAAFLLLPCQLIAQQWADAEIWEREEAWRAAVSVDTQAKQGDLHRLLKTGDDKASLTLIREISSEESWPAPAREKVIFNYVSSLRNETPQAVGKELISYLQTYQSTVLVPHEDHPSSGVPLFNIKAATAGVVNGWARQEAAFEGAAMVSSDPAKLPEAYAAESSLPRQQGFLDALETASPSQLKAVSQYALQEMVTRPEFQAVATRSALINMDFDVLLQLAESADGSGVHTLFGESAMRLENVQIQQLLQAAIRNPSGETAALAIAQLAPALAGHEPGEALLLEMLGDPALGSSAALALVANPSNKIIQELQELAAPENTQLAAIRARLALDIHASRLMTGAQQ
jgi:hypothetical protein